MHINHWNNLELVPLYQRIVHLKQPFEDFGFEATIRGKTSTGECILPSVLFQQTRCKQMLLDYKARQIAIREAGSVVKDSLLFLNCHPLSLQAGFIFEEVDRLEVPVKQIVLEITEHTRITHVESVKSELTKLRKHGLKVALDDFGAGFSNFWLVETLEPDYIKLDRSIIAHIDQSALARRIIEGIVAFAEKVKIDLIAEGIERETQKDLLAELGVVYGQGFFLGHPFAPEKIRDCEGKVSRSIEETQSSGK